MKIKDMQNFLSVALKWVFNSMNIMSFVFYNFFAYVGYKLNIKNLISLQIDLKSVIKICYLVKKGLAITLGISTNVLINYFVEGA